MRVYWSFTIGGKRTRQTVFCSFDQAVTGTIYFTIHGKKSSFDRPNYTSIQVFHFKISVKKKRRREIRFDKQKFFSELHSNLSLVRCEKTCLTVCYKLFTIKLSSVSLRGRGLRTNYKVHQWNTTYVTQIPWFSTVIYGKNNISYPGHYLWGNMSSGFCCKPSFESFMNAIRNMDMTKVLHSNYKTLRLSILRVL